jgi:hypothetical protein
MGWCIRWWCHLRKWVAVFQVLPPFSSLRTRTVWVGRIVTFFTQCMHATHAWQRCTERGCRQGHRLIAFQLFSFN